MLIKARFRFPEILFGMLLAVAIFAIGAVFFSSPNSSPPTQVQAGAQSNDHGARNKQEIAWWKDPVAIFTLGLVFIGAVHACIFYGQLRLIGKSLRPAEAAAKAAELNAKAVMDASGSHLYPVIVSSNLKDVFYRAVINPNTGQDSDRALAPTVTYAFKNYGKSPAVLHSIECNIQFFSQPSKARMMYIEDTQPIEIIGADETSAEHTFQMRDNFNVGMTKAVHGYESELIFYGVAEFKDFFDRQFKCIWEFNGRRTGFHLVRYEEREDSDAKA